MPVYEYDGKHYELPDGLSNEQAIATIQGHLGAAKTAAEPKEDNPLLRGYGVGMRGVIRGLSAPVNIVADGAAGAFNVGANLVGSDVRAPYLSQLQADALDARQYEGQQVYPKAATAGEKLTQSSTEAVTGALATGAFAPQLAPNTQGKLASTAAGAAVAEPAGDVVKEWTGSDVAATAASMLASMAAGSAAGRGVDVLTNPKAPRVTMEQVESRARAAYQTVDNSGVALRPLSAQAMVNRIEGELRRNNYRPTVFPRVETVLNQLREDIGQQRVSFRQLEQLRGLANALKTDNDPSVQRLGSILIREFDNQVANVTQRDLMPVPGSSVRDFNTALEAVQAARRDWRALSKATMLEDVINIAEIRKSMPSASESELIRQGFMRIATDKKKMANFSTDEQRAILEVTRGIPLDGPLGQIAKFSPTRNQLSGTAQGGSLLAGAMSGRPEVAATAAGVGALTYGADKLQSALRRQQAEGVINQILSGQRRVTPEDLHSIRGLFGGAVNLQDR